MANEDYPVMHPGILLKEMFLKPLNISAYRLSICINVPESRISQILSGKRAISADTALRLAAFFGNDPLLWMDSQARWDLFISRKKIHNDLLDIKPFSPSDFDRKRR